MSNLVWAYAKTGVSHPRLFDFVAYEMIEHRQLCAFKPQDLSNIVWAYATAKVSDCRLFEKVADETVHRGLRNFSPQDFSSMVWAYATANISHPRLFEKVTDEVAYRSTSSFCPKDLSILLWAYATSGVSHPRLFEKVADEITCREEASFDHRALSNIVWAFATAKAPSPLLFERIAGAIIVAIVEQKDEFNPQDIANVLWAYAASGNLGAPLFAALAPRAADLLHQCNHQNLANIAWSYAVADVDAPVLFSGRFVEALVQKKDDLESIDLCQLHQWRLWMGENKPTTVVLPLALQEKCHKAFRTSRCTTGSSLQNSVVSVLRSIDLEPKEEYLTKKGYSVDALVEVNGKQVGVEVDGPWHFNGRTPTGNTLLKRRQIANVEGIKLVSVPFWEWYELGHNRYKKQHFLRSLLGM